MDWVIQPYVGVGNIKFGMDQNEIQKILGQPEDVLARKNNSINEYRTDITIPITHYTNGILDEITFSRQTEILLLNDMNILRQNEKTVLEYILKLDPDTKYYAETVISLGLGLSFTGFHNGEESDKAVTVFARGVFDILIGEAVPFVLR
jgi:hypothetical protein